MRTNDAKFLEMLEKIDPSVRRKRLEEERKRYEEMFLANYSDLQGQRRLVKRYESLRAEAQAVLDGLGEDEDAERAQRALRQAEAALEQTQHQQDVYEMGAEHFRDELSRCMEQLDEMQKAGLPKDEPSANGTNREARRRAKA